MSFAEAFDIRPSLRPADCAAKHESHHRRAIALDAPCRECECGANVATISRSTLAKRTNDFATRCLYSVATIEFRSVQVVRGNGWLRRSFPLAICDITPNRQTNVSMTKWIKICGITSTTDATMIAAAGASAIGLNFYRKSKRYIAPAVAKSISDAIRPRLDVVGVFVNSETAEILTIADAAGLNAVQFHGDESTAQILEVHTARPDLCLIRAYRVGAAGLADMHSSLVDLSEAGVRLSAVLVDAYVAGKYGGTGHQVDPTLFNNHPQQWPRLVLAGGLNPDSAKSAAAAVHPWGVDTASGVELSAGVKCPLKVERFIAAVGGDGSDRLDPVL